MATSTLRTSKSKNLQPLDERETNMKTNLLSKASIRSIVIKSAVALALAAPFAASAESNFTTGPGSPITANARLDFQIIIPKVLFLQVGTGTNMAANATINQIAF